MLVLRALAFAGCVLVDLLPNTEVDCRFDAPLALVGAPAPASGSAPAECPAPPPSAGRAVYGDGEACSARAADAVVETASSPPAFSVVAVHVSLMRAVSGSEFFSPTVVSRRSID